MTETAAFLLRHARPARSLLLGATVARTAGLLAGVALLAVIGGATGRLAVGLEIRVPVVLALLAGVALGKAVLRYLEQLLGHIAAFRLLGELRLAAFDALVPQAPQVSAGRGSGEVTAAVTTDIDRLEVFYAHTLAPLVTAVLVPAGVIAATCVMAGPVLALICGVGLLVGLMLTWFAGRRIDQQLHTQLRAVRSALAQQLTDDVNGRVELRIFGAGPQRLHTAGQLADRIDVSLRGIGLWQGVRGAASVAWLLGTVIAAICYGLGRIPMPELLCVLGMVVGTAPALTSVERCARALPAGLAAARHLRELMTAAPLVTDPDAPLVLSGGDIVLSDVSWSYPGTVRPALDGVNMTIPAGAFVGIIGPSGSGKSTLAGLLTRTFDPDSGSITIGGVDLRSARLAEVRRHVTVAAQRVVLLPGSLADNLRLGAPEASDDDLARVCEQAGLTECALDTPLAERGGGLSGGQAQRVAYARALLRNSPVLVADEFTAHQDALTQRHLIAALRRSYQGTLICIAHRMAVVADADWIVELDDGRVIRQGPLDMSR